MAAVAARQAPGPLARARHWASGFRSRETWAAFAFMSPWMFGFVVFTAGPMIASFILSFTDYSIISTTHNVGLANYSQMIHDPKVASAMKTTLIFTAMVVPAHVIVALGLAVLLARVGKIAGFFRVVFFLPTMTPAVAVGVLYLLLFNGDYGLINNALGWVHIKGPYWEIDPNWVKPSLVLMLLWQVGGSVVIFLAAIVGVPKHLYEASAMDGAGAWRRFRDVTLPMISPAIFFIVIINTISALQTFDVVYTAFFNQNTQYGTDATLFYAIYLFQQAFTYFRLGYASALAWGLFLVIAIVTAIQIVGSRRFVYYEGQSKK
jgi:multiple sugar transport system permease protein